MSIKKCLPNRIWIIKAIPWILWLTFLSIGIIAGTAPPGDGPGGGGTC